MKCDTKVKGNNTDELIDSLGEMCFPLPFPEGPCVFEAEVEDILRRNEKKIGLIR